MACFAAAAILRTGIRRMGDHQGFVEAVIAFPDVAAYWRTSLLPLGIAKMLGISGVAGWLSLHIVVTAIVIIGIGWFAVQRFAGESSLVVFGLFVFGPLGTILFGGLGFYDVWVIAGAALLVLGDSSPLRIVGALLLLGGNFELGCVALLSYALFLAAQGDWRTMRLSIFESVLSIGAMFGLLTWVYRDAPDPDSRGEWLVDQASGSIVNSITVFPLLLFSFFGITWLVIGRHLIHVGGVRFWILAFVGLVGVPGLMAAITLDGTRVFVTVAAPATIAVLFSNQTVQFVHNLLNSKKKLLLAAALIPALQIHMGEVINPYAELYGRLGWF
jgi:hypothetical protein